MNSATGDQAHKLLTSAKAAAKSAASVHMKGQFIQGGQARYRRCAASSSRGTPDSLAISAKKGKEAITFSQWNKVPAIQAPPKGQIVSAGGL